MEDIAICNEIFVDDKYKVNLNMYPFFVFCLDKYKNCVKIHGAVEEQWGELVKDTTIMVSEIRSLDKNDPDVSSKAHILRGEMDRIVKESGEIAKELTILEQDKLFHTERVTNLLDEIM